jgi:hypothetical protein
VRVALSGRISKGFKKCFPENDKKVSKIHNLLILAPKIVK